MVRYGWEKVELKHGDYVSNHLTSEMSENRQNKASYSKEAEVCAYPSPFARVLVLA